MSDTDKTKPWWVRVNEHRSWAVHDHRNGECNLPASPLGHHDAGSTTWRNFDCRWSDWNICYDGCCHGCGCRICSDYYGHRAMRRRQRHTSQRRAQQLLKEFGSPRGRQIPDWDA